MIELVVFNTSSLEKDEDLSAAIFHLIYLHRSQKRANDNVPSTSLANAGVGRFLILRHHQTSCHAEVNAHRTLGRIVRTSMPMVQLGLAKETEYTVEKGPNDRTKISEPSRN